MAKLLLCSIIALTFAIVSSQNTKDPLNDFCRRFGHQSAVVDRRLYIDGGLVNWNPISQNAQNYSNQYLSYHDLDVTTQDGMPQLHASLSKNDSIPNVSGGVLWADEVNKLLYLYGGEFQGSAQEFRLWIYDTILDQWHQPEHTASAIQRVSWGAGVAVNERAEGYYLGGWLSNQTVPGWVGEPKMASTLIKYDMVGNVWTNNAGPDDNGRAEGVMVYIPASDKGLLIYFGGIWDPFKNGTVVGSPMSTIYIYDIASAKWYTQNATGDTPDMRRRFCAGATWAADYSSYNIYLYGGAGIPPTTSGFDDVYILTLPSFIWIKWWPTEPGPGKPHNSLTCNVIDNSQMLIIGGTFPLSDECDSPSTWGVHNLNLGKNSPKMAMWDLYFPNITEYTVPSEVVAHIGGWATGGATVKSPARNWDNRDLPVYFSRVAQFSARTPTRSILSATASSSPTPSGTLGSQKGNNVAAIAGGAAGGGVGLILLIALILYCLHRHKKSRKQRQSAPAELDGKNIPRTPNVESRSEPSPGMQSVPPAWTTTPPQLPTDSGFPTPTSPTTIIPASPPSPIAYMTPVSPYGPHASQGQYFIPVVPAPAQYPQQPYPPPQFVPPSPMSQQQAQAQAQAHPYNPAEHAFHQQHFPPPPSGSQSAPTPASTYSNSTAPPSQTQTPANFYPQPLNLSRPTVHGAPGTLNEAQRRFIEEED